jgi:hypothetical protein
MLLVGCEPVLESVVTEVLVIDVSELEIVFRSESNDKVPSVEGRTEYSVVLLGVHFAVACGAIGSWKETMLSPRRCGLEELWLPEESDLVVVGSFPYASS